MSLADRAGSSATSSTPEEHREPYPSVPTGISATSVSSSTTRSDSATSGYKPQFRTLACDDQTSVKCGKQWKDNVVLERKEASKDPV